MKKLHYIWLLAIVMCCWSCSSGSGEDEPAPTPTPTEKTKIEITSSAPVIEQKGGTATVTFTSNASWTATVSESRSVDWCTVSPTSGGEGTVTLTITTKENDTYDERNASVTIKAGTASQSFTVSQKQKDALTVTSNKVELKAEGGDFAIEAQANVSVSYEIEEAAKEWISVAGSRGLTTTTLNFTAKANENLERRQGTITLKGGDGLTETVTVYQEGEAPTIVVSSDDVIVSSEGETVKIELKSNVEYTMVLPQVDWISQTESRAISTYTHYLTIAPNDTYDQRNAFVYFQNEAKNLRDSISITQLQKDAIIVAKNEYEVEAESSTLEFSVNTNVDFAVETSVDWIKQNTESRALVEKPLSFTIEENSADESREGTITISYNNLKQEIKVIQKGAIDYEAIERAALIELYNATNGDNWLNKENWCSDKPVSEWYGISVYENGRVKDIALWGNYLEGKLPESFSVFLDGCVSIYLAYNRLHGVIPESIRNHSKWSRFGWGIIPQSKGYGDTGDPIAFDTKELNLLISDKDLLSLDEKSTFNSIEFIRNSEYTLAVTMEMDLTMDYYNFDRLVNLCLGYQNKGLTVLLQLQKTFDGDYERFGWEERIKNLPTNNLNFIIYTGNSESNLSFFDTAGNVGLFNKEGYALEYLYYYNYNFEEESAGVLLAKETEELIKKHLGDPEEHPFYSSEKYTSTDFSKDGEVTILQEASIGEGLDLVFMGDAFVDKAMEEGGTYEQAMKQGVEEMFAIEPYKSLKNRFNIYMVKAVSPNASFKEDAKRAINSDADCFKYAQKIPEINMDNVGIIMITNPSTISENSYCVSYEDNSYIVFIMSGRLRRGTIAHEVGHGLGRLLDEYVNPGYEFNKISEESQIALDESWRVYGWGANVDWRNDPETVRWAHFLKDERYAAEGLGIFEGANVNFGLGCYRPTENSIMNDDYNHPYFNAPCREQLYKVIMKRSEGESWTYDYEEFVRFDEINRNATSRSAVKPLTEAERREYIKNHRPPTFIKGTWRDAMKNGKGKITIPLR